MGTKYLLWSLRLKSIYDQMWQRLLSYTLEIPSKLNDFSPFQGILNAWVKFPTKSYGEKSAYKIIANVF